MIRLSVKSNILVVALCFTLFISKDNLSNAQSAPTYRLCVPEQSLTTCNAMVEALSAAGGRIICTSANDKVGCITKVGKNESDFLPLEPEEIYVAHRFEKTAFHVITEVRSAEFKDRDFRYEPVAVIRKSSGISSISDLEGKRSCHTAFGRNAGWKIPFSHLMDKNQLTKYCDAAVGSTVEKDLYAVSNYFSDACAAGAWVPEKDSDRKLKERFPNLCSLCKSPNECATTDKYVGYEGALRCLTEGTGDVAWTKLDAVEKFFKLKEQPVPITAEYAFLCWDGSSQSLTTPNPCSWAKRPWRGFIASRRLSTSSIKDLQEQISTYHSEGAKSANTSNIIPAWMTQVLEIDVTEVPFNYQPNLAKTISPSNYLDSRNYTVTIEKPSCGVKTNIKFCVRSEVEKLKCMDLRLAAFGRRILPSLHCILGEGTKDCMQKIKNEEADVMSVTAKEAHYAEREYGLTTILTELEKLDSEGDVGPFRYAVAVARKEIKFVNISSLRGLKSCHGSVRSLAGWNVPLSVLRDAKEIEGKTCGLTLELAQYFNGTCVPGAKDPLLKMDWLPESLCSLCVGDSEGGQVDGISPGFCNDDTSERYFGDAGALRCLSDKAADVAFVDHVALQSLGEEVKADEIQLLCPNGSKMEINQARHCNWGKVPSNKVIVRSGDENIVNREDTRVVLLKAADNFRPGAGAAKVFRLFGPYYGNSDLLFEDTSVGLADESEAKLLNTQIIKDFDDCTTSTANFLKPSVYINILFCSYVIRRLI